MSCNGVDFCYLCIKKWNHNGLQICGNLQCETYVTEDSIKNCKSIVLETHNRGQVIPEMRACPKCLAIITYQKNCKHIVCPRKDCKHEFCFGCLQKWPCSLNVCEPAPRQQL